MGTIKKIIGIILAFTFLVSAGSIYAKSDSAANLSNWYETSFHKKSGELGATTANAIGAILKNANIFIVKSKDIIDSSIESFRDEQVRKVVAGIVDYREDIKSQVDNTVTELQKENNFDDYAEKANIDEVVEKDVEDILAEVLNEKSTK